MLEIKPVDSNVVNEVVSWSIQDSVAIICLDSPPVNALSSKVRTGLKAALEAAYADANAKSIVLACAGATFIAGADISEFGRPEEGVGLHELLECLDSAPKPLVAATHGTCLGGGLEVALCAHERVAVESAKFGFPEVHLGIIPGAGGTQRLPRLANVEDALSMIVSGKPVSAAKAHNIGFIDQVVQGDELLSTAVERAKSLADSGEALVRVRDRSEKLADKEANLTALNTWVDSNQKMLRGPRAPSSCVEAIKAALTLPTFDEGMAVEARIFADLVMGDESAAQRHYFFAEREANKIPDIPKGTPIRKIEKVGVIGAGLMGSGIATCIAASGFAVTVVETQQENLDRGLLNIRKNFEVAVSKGKMKAEIAEHALTRLNGTVEMQGLADCDLVIEAVFERMDVKKSIFSTLDSVCKPGAILASNTSALDLNEIAESTQRPGDVIGLHFFSPANIMRLLEIVRGAKTEKDVVATALKLGKKIGKVSVVSGVCPGFIGNRILFPRQDQAQALLLEGATPWQVDKVNTDFGMPMGPFAMADLAGLDLGWVKEESNSSTIFEVLNEMGRHGQKTRAGFYDYDEKRKPSPSSVVAQALKDFAAKQGAEVRELNDEEILDRCLLPMINEGAKILEEGIAIRSSDIDVVWVNGYGWPVYKGGPMFYADQLGLAEVLKRLRALEEKHGDAFKPAALIEKLAAEGKQFAQFRLA